jgi:ankyrin repeat protein
MEIKATRQTSTLEKIDNLAEHDKKAPEKPAFVVVNGPRYVGENNGLLEGFPSKSEQLNIPSLVIDNSNGDMSEAQILEQLTKSLQPKTQIWITVHGRQNKQHVHSVAPYDIGDLLKTYKFVHKLRNIELQGANGEAQKFEGIVHIISCQGSPKKFNDPALGPVIIYSSDNIHTGFPGWMILDLLLDHIGLCIDDPSAMEHYCSPDKIYDLVSSQGIATIYIPPNSNVATITSHDFLIEESVSLTEIYERVEESVSLTVENNKNDKDHDAHAALFNAVMQAAANGEIKKLRSLQQHPYIQWVLKENVKVERNILNMSFNESPAFMFCRSSYPGMELSVYEWAIENGVDFVAQKNADGNTPLMELCKLNWHEADDDDREMHEKIAQMICEKQDFSAHKNVRNLDGKNAFEIACASTNLSMVKVLLAHEEKPSVHTLKEILKEMCRLGPPNCNKGEKEIYTKRYCKLINMLCSQLVSTELLRVNEEGMSLLHVAVKENNADMVAALTKIALKKSVALIFVGIGEPKKTARELASDTKIKQAIFKVELTAFLQNSSELRRLNATPWQQGDSPLSYICKGGLELSAGNDDVRQKFLKVVRKLLKTPHWSEDQRNEIMMLAIQAGDYELTVLISKDLMSLQKYKDAFAQSPNVKIKIFSVAKQLRVSEDEIKKTLYANLASKEEVHGITKVERLEICYEQAMGDLRKSLDASYWKADELTAPLTLLHKILEIATEAQLQNINFEAELRAIEMTSNIANEIKKTLMPSEFTGPLMHAINYYTDLSGSGYQRMLTCVKLFPLLPSDDALQVLMHPVQVKVGVGKATKITSSPLVMGIKSGQGEIVLHFIDMLEIIAKGPSGTDCLADLKGHLLEHKWYKSDFGTDQERTSAQKSMKLFIEECVKHEMMKKDEGEALLLELYANMSNER